MTGRDATPLFIGGGTDAKLFPNSIAFGPTTPEEEERLGFNYHGENERVDVYTLTTAAVVYTVTAATLLGSLAP